MASRLQQTEAQTAKIYALFAKWLVLTDYDPALATDSEEDVRRRDDAIAGCEAEILSWRPTHELQIIPMIDILFSLEGEPPLAAEYGTLARIKLFLTRSLFCDQDQPDNLSAAIVALSGRSAVRSVMGVHEAETAWADTERLG